MFYGIAYSMYNVTRWVGRTVVELFYRLTENGDTRITETNENRETE